MTENIFTSRTSTQSTNFNPSSRIVCRVCEKQFTQYTCPRCNIRYCSLQCYKTHSLHCTESFMRDNVVEELRQLQSDEGSKKKMMDILKRFHEEAETNSMDDAETDSFLSEETVQRILSGDLKSLDELSTEEMRHFTRAIASGELGKLIEPWNPWWLKHSAKYISLSSNGTQLVKPILKQDRVSASEDVGDNDQLHDIPPGPETSIPSVSKLTNSRPSPLLALHVVDLIFSYCFTLRLYNGDWVSDPLESVMVMVSVSSILDQRVQPETVFEALLHCLEITCSNTYKHVGGLQFGLTLMDDVSSVLRLGGAALVCLLCDLQRMIQAAEKALKFEETCKSKRADLKRKLKFAEHKVYFMMCWVHEQPAEVWSVLAATVNAEKSSVMQHADSKRGNPRIAEKPERGGKPLIKEV